MIPPFLLSILKGQLQEVLLDGKATASVPDKGLSAVKQGDIIEGRIVGHNGAINILDYNGDRLKVRSQVELPIGAKVRLRVSRPSTPVEVKLQSIVEDGSRERLHQSEKEMARLEASFSRLKGLVGQLSAKGPDNGQEAFSNGRSSSGIDGFLKALGISGTAKPDDIKALALLQQKGMSKLLSTVASRIGINGGSGIQKEAGVSPSGEMSSVKEGQEGSVEPNGSGAGNKVQAKTEKSEAPSAILEARRRPAQMRQNLDREGVKLKESFLDQGVKDAKVEATEKTWQAPIKGAAEGKGLFWGKDSTGDMSLLAFSKTDGAEEVAKNGSTGGTKVDGALGQEASTKMQDTKGPKLDTGNQVAKAQGKVLTSDSNGSQRTYLPESKPIGQEHQIFLKTQKISPRGESSLSTRVDEKALPSQNLAKETDATKEAAPGSRPQHDIEPMKNGLESSSFQAGIENQKRSDQGALEQQGHVSLSRHTSSAKDMDGVLIREFSNHVDVANQIQHHVLKETGQQLFIFPLLFSGLEGAGQWSFWKEQEEGQGDTVGQDAFHITFDLYMKSLGQLNIHILQKEERLSLFIGAEKEMLPIVRKGLSDIIERIKTLGYRFETINCYCLEEEQVHAVSSMPLDQGEASRFHLIT